MEKAIVSNISMLCFFSGGCTHCEEIKKKIQTTGFDIDIDLTEINIDMNKEMALKYSINYTPTILVFKDGELINNIVGGNECLSVLNNLFSL